MPHVNNAIFILLDPKYIDQKMAVISVPINQSFNEATEYYIIYLETGRDLPKPLSNFMIT